MSVNGLIGSMDRAYVVSGHRNDQGSIPGNAWIFQVLFQLLRLLILYWKIIFTFIKSLHSTKQYISVQTWAY